MQHTFLGKAFSLACVAFPSKSVFLVRQISSCPCPHVNTQKRRMKTSTRIGKSENEHHENRCLSKVSSVGKEQWGVPHLEM